MPSSLTSWLRTWSIDWPGSILVDDDAEDVVAPAGAGDGVCSKGSLCVTVWRWQDRFRDSQVSVESLCRLT